MAMTMTSLSPEELFLFQCYRGCNIQSSSSVGGGGGGGRKSEDEVEAARESIVIDLSRTVSDLMGMLCGAKGLLALPSSSTSSATATGTTTTASAFATVAHGEDDDPKKKEELKRQSIMVCILSLCMFHDDVCHVCE